MLPLITLKRYLWVTSMVVIAVITLLLVGVNVAFRSYQNEQTQHILDLVMQYGVGLDGAEAGDYPARRMIQSTDCFTAVVDGNGKVTMNLASLSGLTEREAAEILSMAVRNEDGTTGMAGTFAFLREADAKGTVRYAFVDIEETAEQAGRLRTVSLALGSVAAVCAAGFVWAAAHAWLWPLVQKAADSASLMITAGETLKKEPALSDTARETADGLAAAGRVLRGSKTRKTIISLSEVLSNVCRTAAPAVKELGGKMTADVEPDIWVRGIPGEIEGICRFVLESAVRLMQPKGEVRVDLLTDGRQAGIVVQSICAMWEDGSEPENASIGVVRFLAEDNGGTATCVTIPPNVVCTSVLLPAVPPETARRSV